MAAHLNYMKAMKDALLTWIENEFENEFLTAIRKDRRFPIQIDLDKKVFLPLWKSSRYHSNFGFEDCVAKSFSKFIQRNARDKREYFF